MFDDEVADDYDQDFIYWFKKLLIVSNSDEREVLRLLKEKLYELWLEI